MSSREYFDLFDSENRPLNKKKERQLVHRDGDWHRTSQVWVLNDKREVLCNLRSQEKDLFPLHWDLSIGGHVIAGDNYENTALREMEEELGIKATSSELEFLGDEKTEGVDKETNLIDKEHVRLFLYNTKKTLSDFKIQKDEILEIDYFKIEDLVEKLGNRDHSFKVIPIKLFFLKVLTTLANTKT